MGTRHLICIYHNGRFVLAQYGQWDGYPDGQGVVILAFVKAPGNVALLASKTPNIEPLIIAEVDDYIKGWTLENPNAETPMFSQPCPPSLSRNTGAKMLDLIAASTSEAWVPVYLELDFVKDGLFCEWAYVIDLDRETLEVYCGGERSHYEGDTSHVSGVRRLDETEGSVVSLVGRWGFTSLPEETHFINVCRTGLELPDEEDGESLEDNGDRTGSEIDGIS
nr:hypothetical protein B0A51_08342 [Rachicladosporium sp. CCFEE 5018]